MKIVKRNQIIILVIALMLVSAGYLNYTTGNNNIEETSSLDTEIEYAGIGDAKLVSNNSIVEENIVEGSLVENDNTTYNETNNEKISDSNNEITQTTNNEVEDKEANEYFSSSRLSRETMYSQMLESYQKILENESISSEQRSIAQTEIKNINDTKNKIMICENLIKTKGIEDLIIFVNDQSISVIVKGKTLEQEQIAQIQNIITREMQTDITNIHISNK